MYKILIVVSVSSLFLVCTLLYVLGVLGVQTADSKSKPPDIGFVGRRSLSDDNGIAAALPLGRNRIIGIASPKPQVVFSNGSAGWKQKDLPAGGWAPNAISMLDSRRGYIVGNYGTILRTEDGGNTWELLPHVSDFDFNAVAFQDSRIGYVAGRFGRKNPMTQEDEWQAEILKTEDGGNNWSRVFADERSRQVFQIAVDSTGSTVAALLDGRRLMTSNDKGLTWTPSSLPDANFSAIAFSPSGQLWLVGPGNVFLVSTDGGISWKQFDGVAQKQGTTDWNSIAFDKQGHGLAVSERGLLFTH